MSRLCAALSVGFSSEHLVSVAFSAVQIWIHLSYCVAFVQLAREELAKESICGVKHHVVVYYVANIQNAVAFKYIHSEGLIHRDAKPENMLMGDGKQEQGLT